MTRISTQLSVQYDDSSGDTIAGVQVGGVLLDSLEGDLRAVGGLLDHGKGDVVRERFMGGFGYAE